MIFLKLLNFHQCFFGVQHARLSSPLLPDRSYQAIFAVCANFARSLGLKESPFSNNFITLDTIACPSLFSSMTSLLNFCSSTASDKFPTFLLVAKRQFLTQPFLNLVIGSYDQIRIARIKCPL